MKQSVQRDISQVSKIAEPTRSRPAQRKTSASGGHLAQLAAIVNASPRAESLMTLAAEINQDSPVQHLREAGGAESGVQGPAQLRLEVEGTLAHGDRSGNLMTENAGDQSADTGGESVAQSSCGCSVKANTRSGGESGSPSKKLPAQKKDAARSQAATQKPAQGRTS
jgi:hypothetical protein